MIGQFAKRLRQWRPLLLMMVATLTIILSNCGETPDIFSSPGATTSPVAPTGEQTALVFGLGGQPGNLEPGNITDNNSILCSWPNL